jgi:homoserine O-acetyltransferase
VLGGISANCFPALRPDGAAGWWRGLAGEGSAIDPARHCIIGMDFAADSSGRTAPSTFDQARVLAAALDAIGVDRPVTIVGASYGGMVALALAEIEPQRIGRLVLIGAAEAPHPTATAARELQRRTVALGIEAGRGEEALAIARGMAILTYRTPQEFKERFDGGIDDCFPISCSKPGGYLRARGLAFLSVMSPGRFLSLSASIDRHRVRPERVTAPTLLIGASSDQLVFPEQLRALYGKLAGPAQLHLLDSLFGHDMFLKEAECIGRIVAPFLVPE